MKKLIGGVEVLKAFYSAGYTLEMLKKLGLEVACLQEDESNCSVHLTEKFISNMRLVSWTIASFEALGAKWVPISEEVQSADKSAVSMLQEAASCIGDRASERDTDSERSMAATVKAFNVLYGTELSEEQGWQFMTLLKMSRAKGGKFRRDDYVDGAAYFALAGECAAHD